VTRTTRILLLVLTLVGAGLRFAHLGHHSLWLDETVSADASEDLSRALRSVAHPPLSYVALGLWTRVFGRSDAALRGLAALAGTVMIPLVFAVARRAFARDGVALAAAALLTIMPEAIWHSRQVRHYSLWPCFVLLALWALLAQREPASRTRATVGYWAATALAMATHYYTAFYAIALAIAAWLVIGERPLVKRREDVRRWLVLQLPLLVVPLGFLLYRWLLWGWVRVGAAFTEFIRGRIVQDLAGMVFHQPWIRPDRPSRTVVLGVLLIVALCLALVLALRDRKVERQVAWALAVVLWLPYLAVELLPVRAHGRLLAPTLPVLVLWLGYLIAAPLASRVAAGARAVVVVLALATLAPYVRSVYAIEMEPWKSVCADIAAAEAPRTVVLVNEPFMRRPLRRCYTARAPVLPFPKLKRDIRRRTLPQIVAPYDEVWFIYSHAWRTDQRREGLGIVRQTHELIGQRSYGPLIDVYHLRRTPR
jgi:uncharacterized membrane protein